MSFPQEINFYFPLVTIRSRARMEVLDLLVTSTVILLRVLWINFFFYAATPQKKKVLGKRPDFCP